MRLKETDPAYRAAQLYVMANEEARAAIEARRYGRGSLAHLHALNARGHRELARALLRAPT